MFSLQINFYPLSMVKRSVAQLSWTLKERWKNDPSRENEFIWWRKPNKNLNAVYMFVVYFTNELLTSPAVRHALKAPKELKCKGLRSLQVILLSEAPNWSDLCIKNRNKRNEKTVNTQLVQKTAAGALWWVCVRCSTAKETFWIIQVASFSIKANYYIVDLPSCKKTPVCWPQKKHILYTVSFSRESMYFLKWWYQMCRENTKKKIINRKPAGTPVIRSSSCLFMLTCHV